MTTSIYKKPDASAATTNRIVNEAGYPTHFDIRNPAAVRKLGVGLSAAALLLALATPTGREVALNIGHETRSTLGNIATSARYGDAGIITYTRIPVRFPYETTPRAIAREIAGTDARNFPGIEDLLAFCITGVNQLPNEDATIKAGQLVTTLVSDPNGQNLGSLADSVKKQPS